MLEAQYWTDQEKYEVLTEKAWFRNSLFFLKQIGREKSNIQTSPL